MSPAPTIRRDEANAQMDRMDRLLNDLDTLITQRCHDLDLPDLPTDTTENHGDRPPHPR